MAPPIMGSVLLILALIVAPYSKVPCTLRGILNWPQFWDLLFWVILLSFPTISRKTLTIYDCVEYEDRRLLRVDPVLSCDDDEWKMGGLLAGLGAAVYCLGVPLFMMLFARHYIDGDDKDRRVVQSFTSNYKRECWYFESIDLVRKFLLTGIISIVQPRALCAPCGGRAWRRRKDVGVDGTCL